MENIKEIKEKEDSKGGQEDSDEDNNNYIKV